MNGPEGFLPKKLNFTMQVVQVLWYRPEKSKNVVTKFEERWMDETKCVKTAD